MTDIDIQNNLNNICTFPDVLNNIIIEYLNICMMCQETCYPIYKNKIYKYNGFDEDLKISYKICTNCIWSHLSCSIALPEFSVIFSKYPRDKECICVNCDKIFGLSNLKKHLSTSSHLSYTINDNKKTKIKCFCGCILDINNGTYDIKTHKKSDIHTRGQDILTTFTHISFIDKDKVIDLLFNTAKPLINFLSPIRTKHLQKIDCLYKFYLYAKDNIKTEKIINE